VRLIAEKLNMGICSQERTQTLAWLMDSQPWQCPCAWCVKEFTSSWLRSPLQKWTMHFIDLTYPPAIFGSFQN
jgi:hypothetical protein